MVSNIGRKYAQLIWQSDLINVSLRAVGIQKFFRTLHRRCFFDGGGAPATPILSLFRIAIDKSRPLGVSRAVGIGAGL